MMASDWATPCRQERPVALCLQGRSSRGALCLSGALRDGPPPSRLSGPSACAATHDRVTGVSGSSRSARRVSSRPPYTKYPRGRSGVSPSAAPREFGRGRERATTAPPPDRLPLWGIGQLSSNSTAMPSRALRRAPFTFWLCIRVKSQARRLVHPLPATLLGNRSDEGVLDEVVCPGHVAGQRKSIPSQPRDFFFEKSTEFVHLTLRCSRQSAS